MIAVEMQASAITAAREHAKRNQLAVRWVQEDVFIYLRAAEKAGWGAPMPMDTGLGVATTFGQERAMPTWVACVARVHVDRRSGDRRTRRQW